jgi:hypothetical protein
MMLDFAVAALGLSGFVVVLCALDAAAVLWRMWRGDEPVPYRLSRRYWRRKFVRLVCRLAALEAEWENRKIPRKSGTKRGTVCERVRRSRCMYSQIIPQIAGDVKGDFAVRWNWMRG